MLTRIALLIAALFAVPALAQTAPAPGPDIVKVAIDTSLGRIVVALDRGHAPLTTGNFLKYVDGHRFDGESFYRAMPYGAGGLVQGGITSDARKLLPPVAHEPTSQTGLHNVAGTIAMARLDPGSARSDFFIELGDIPAFDASAADPGFAAFGHVVEGVMKGQMLEPAVRILKMGRVEN